MSLYCSEEIMRTPRPVRHDEPFAHAQDVHIHAQTTRHFCSCQTFRLNYPHCVPTKFLRIIPNNATSS